MNRREREIGDEGRREGGWECMLGLGLGGWVLRDAASQWSEVRVGVWPWTVKCISSRWAWLI